MIRKLVFALALVALVLPLGLARAGGAEVQTRNLVAVDATGGLSEAELRGLADEAQALLERVLAFWSAEDGIERYGKIRVLFDAPRRGNYACVFYWEKGQRERVRAVRVFGFKGGPKMLAHKFTSALMPQPDKLLRNMMGIVAETRLGDPLTFPRCGLGSDAWVLALLKAGRYVPLKALGPEHESWGMADSGGGRLMVFDRATQHRAYAEAGSFGNYLLDVYGVEKLRQLQRHTGDREQLLREVFGQGLAELEQGWLAALRANEAANQANAATASRLFTADPRTACLAAQRLAGEGK